LSRIDGDLDGILGSLTNAFSTNTVEGPETSAQILSVETLEETVGSLVHIPSVGSSDAPTITVPLSSLHAELSDLVIDFGEEPVAGWVALLRNVSLIIVLYSFTKNSWVLFGRSANV